MSQAVADRTFDITVPVLANDVIAQQDAQASCTQDDFWSALVSLPDTGLRGGGVRARGAMLRQLGVYCSAASQHRQALSYLNQSLVMYEEACETAEVLATRLALYSALRRRALSLPQRSTARQVNLARLLTLWPLLADDATSAGSEQLAAVARGGHGITLHDFGRHRDAVGKLSEALVQYRAFGMHADVAHCCMVLGHCHTALLEHRDAREHYRTAVDLFKSEGGPLDDLQACLEGCSHAQEALGNLQCAMADLREAQEVQQRNVLRECAASGPAAVAGCEGHCAP